MALNEHVLNVVPRECSVLARIRMKFELKVCFRQVEFTEQLTIRKHFESVSNVWNLKSISVDKNRVQNASVEADANTSEATSIVFLRCDCERKVVWTTYRCVSDLASVEPTKYHLVSKSPELMSNGILTTIEKMKLAVVDNEMHR